MTDTVHTTSASEEQRDRIDKLARSISGLCHTVIARRLGQFFEVIGEELQQQPETYGAHKLLDRAVDVMAALHRSIEPMESDPDLAGRVPPAAMRAFVDALAEIDRQRVQCRRPSVGTGSMNAKAHGIENSPDWMKGWNACLDALDAAERNRSDETVSGNTGKQA